LELEIDLRRRQAGLKARANFAQHGYGIGLLLVDSMLEQPRNEFLAPSRAAVIHLPDNVLVGALREKVCFAIPTSCRRTAALIAPCASALASVARMFTMASDSAA
jgi:hypothetical protein